MKSFLLVPLISLTFTVHSSVSFAAKTPFETADETNVVACGGSSYRSTHDVPMSAHIVFSRDSVFSNNPANMYYLTISADRFVALPLNGVIIPNIDTAKKAFELIRKEFPGVIPYEKFADWFKDDLAYLPYSVANGEFKTKDNAGNAIKYKLISINGIKGFSEMSLNILAIVSYDSAGKKSIKAVDYFTAECQLANKKQVAQALSQAN